MSNIDEIFYKEVTELIKTIPNDMELGEKIRRLYLGSENINEDEIKKRNDSCVCGRQTNGENCKSIV
jgi:hypothetical protein